MIKLKILMLVFWVCKIWECNGSSEKCVNLENDKICLNWKTQGFCQKGPFKNRVVKTCQKTCDLCLKKNLTASTTQKTTLVSSTANPDGKAILPSCGTKGISHGRIVGGKNAKEGDWPWQVNIDYRYNTGNPGHHCGGTLINEEWVLSAAHCFYDNPDKNDYWLKLGEHDIKKDNGWEQLYSIKELLLHPQYEHNGFHYDLALLRLNSTAKLNNRVRTACLPGPQLTFPIGTECFITGWGLLQEYGDAPAILQQAKVPLINQNKCIVAFNQLNFNVTQEMLCAGYDTGKIDACAGDSGGPLVCKVSDLKKKTDVWYLWGTISWGVGCARKGLYGVFSNTKVLRSWIDSVVNKKY
ncbi:serine protease 27 isoform X2 [Hydra vulgaris]|uniref:Serine protease 27 isoform X2 n=1 Tax=Hydra vulgaris TaxID=6087 RepID=A0ABM4DJE6_HYDVU